jgi:DNA-binding NarL/FixJ family response regulator
MFYIIPPIMELWERLLTLLRMKPGSAPHYFELDEPVHTALVERADREQRPLAQVQAELLAAGLAHLQTSDGLKQCWETLSGREQEVTALTCLGYTNRQMAARLHVSPTTVKGYVRRALVKWQTHGKEELRILLASWDFSDWGPPAP